MYTAPEDWFDRLKKAGGSACVELGNLAPSPNVQPTPEIEQIWSEIHGKENLTRFRQVHAFLRQVAAPLIGWIDL